MKSNIRKIIAVLSIAIVAIALCVCLAVYNNPVNKVKRMLSSESYSSVVDYYNKLTSGDKKEKIDTLISTKVDDAYTSWYEQEIDYDDAVTAIEPFSSIDNQEIKSVADAHLSLMKIEHTGDEERKKAETFFSDGDFLNAMLCRQNVDPSYSSYEKLSSIYDDSKNNLLKQVEMPVTEKEYEDAISLLKDCGEKTGDKDFEAREEQLESELSDYHDVRAVLVDATESFENEKYHDAFQTLEEGSKKYPESNKIKYAVASYQAAYMLKIYGQVEVLMESKDYESTVELLEEAIANYDCDQFEELLDKAKRKDSVLYNIGASFKDAGDYIFRSGKKLVLGDFDEEDDPTALSIGGNVAASIAGVDTPMDIRDLAYDFTHWGEGDYFAARLALDAVGVIPAIGAIKYLKHLDTVADIVDTTHDTINAADAIHDGINAADAVHDGVNAADATHDAVNAVDATHDAVNAADAAHDAANAADAANDAANVADATHDTANTVDSIHDAENAADTIHDIANASESAEDLSKQLDDIADDVVADVSKKADIVPDLSDDFSDVTKKTADAVDTVDDVSDPAKAVDDVTDAVKDAEKIIPTVSLDDVSKKSPVVSDVYQRLEENGWSEPLEWYPDGAKINATFNNWDEDLPIVDDIGKPITYKEYYILPEGTKKYKWGKLRFVRGSDGIVYYSDDHYESFVRILESLGD